MAKRSLLAMAVVFLLILMTISGWASVPTMMNYQGKLTDTEGKPLNGSYNMTFYLFTSASGGSAIWSENHTDVDVTDGIYNVILGSINPLATGLFNENDLVYLEVEIEGESLDPRQQLTSAPYALKARVSDAVVSGAITTVMIADGAVDSQKVADSAITSGKVASNAITSAKIADGTVTAVDIADGSGSGLDADMLDGLQAIDFVRPSADYGRSGVASNLYEGTSTLSNRYINDDSADTMQANTTLNLFSAIQNGTGRAIYAESAGTKGIEGKATGSNGAGVSGYCYATGGIGVFGQGTLRGIHGYSSDYEGYGVVGEAPGASGEGVRGIASGNYGRAVVGEATYTGFTTTHGGHFTANSSNGRGVYGESTGVTGTGVYGLASGIEGRGVYGENSDSGNYGFLAGVGVGVLGSSSYGFGGFFVGKGYFSGNLGIGKMAPGYKLDVAGRARMLTGDDNSAGIWFTNADDNENRAFFGMMDDDYLGFYGQAGASWGLVFNVNNGNVGIGTNNPGSFKLAVNGEAAKPGGGSWASYSDARLKDIGERYELGLEEITKIDPVKYRYKEDNALGLPSDGEYVGLIAQEVQEVIPEAVQQNKQGYLMVNEGPINYAMLNAIKELSAEVKRLKKRIEELEKR